MGITFPIPTDYLVPCRHGKEDNMRPKKDVDLKRGKSINMRLTDIEFDCIQQSAHEAEMSLSEYC